MHRLYSWKRDPICIGAHIKLSDLIKLHNENTFTFYNIIKLILFLSVEMFEFMISVRKKCPRKIGSLGLKFSEFLFVGSGWGGGVCVVGYPMTTKECEYETKQNWESSVSFIDHFFNFHTLSSQKKLKYPLILVVHISNIYFINDEICCNFFNLRKSKICQFILV